MTKKIIASVLGLSSSYKEISFFYKIKDRQIRGSDFLLSNFFKKSVFSEDDCLQVFFMPHVLYENNENRKTLEKLITHNNAIIIPIYSLIKNNSTPFENFEFNARYENVVFQIFLYLLNIYLENRQIETLYIDISIGLNVYVDALKEAARYFKVFYDLMNFSRSKKLNLKILFSDPIINSKNDNFSYEVFEETISLKVWFDSPIKSSDLNETKLKNNLLGKKEIDILKRFYVTFVSIYKNAPLVIHTFFYDTKEYIFNIIQGMTKKFLTSTQINKNTLRQKKYQILENSNFKISIFLSLALYFDISTFLEEIGLKPLNSLSNNSRNSQNILVDLNELLKFKKIYFVYKLYSNVALLENDIDYMNKKGNLLNENQYSLLASIEGKVRHEKSNARNFFAHSGLERNVTYLKKINDKIYVYYDMLKFCDIIELIYKS